MIHRYHGTSQHARRLENGLDRCPSNSRIYDLDRFLLGGRIYDPREQSSLLTHPIGQDWPPIYAVSLDFELHWTLDSPRTDPTAVKHESLFHNANVRAAGEMYFEKGLIVHFNDHSGSYSTHGRLDTDRNFAQAILLAFDGREALIRTLELRRLKQKAGLPR